LSFFLFFLAKGPRLVCLSEFFIYEATLQIGRKSLVFITNIFFVFVIFCIFTFQRSIEKVENYFFEPSYSRERKKGENGSGGWWCGISL